MKKKLGVLVLTLSALVISAACASSSDSKPPQSDTGGELSGAVRPSELPSQPSDAPADQTARLGR